MERTFLRESKGNAHGTQGERSNGDNSNEYLLLPIPLSQSLLLPHPKTRQRTILSLLSHCNLSNERVCLGTNMADSNWHQGGHVGENQEFSYHSPQFKYMNFHIFTCILHLLWVYYELTKWRAPRWLDSSVGRALNRYRRGHGFESCSGLNFFQALNSQLLKL